MQLKYVVSKKENGLEEIFIFSKSVVHASLAEVLNYIKVGTARNWRREHCEIVGAGFTDGKTCYGESESLGIKSRGTQDSRLLGV